MKVSIIGIDLAKNVFQVAVLGRGAKVVLNRSVARAKLVDLVRRYEAPILAMEAWGPSHYWGRVFRDMGYEVKLIPPQHVKAFARVNKTDAGDALAICEAAQRPEIHPVAIKSIPQQDLRLMCRRRDLMVRQRTALSNQLRGLAKEYGVFFSKGLARLHEEVPLALEDAENELSFIARQNLQDMLQELSRVSERIDQLRAQIQSYIKDNDRCQRLMEIPGVGPLVAASFDSTMGNARQFTNGRQCAACIGLAGARPRCSRSPRTGIATCVAS